jgi:hypothetical protein
MAVDLVPGERDHLLTSPSGIFETGSVIAEVERVRAELPDLDAVALDSYVRLVDADEDKLA